MSYLTPQDPERGNVPNVNLVHSQKTPNQPPQVESNFGDSSGPLFSMYTKAAEEEDNKMVERWQKDADGVLIFAGLFSASVAALLSVSVGDLRPSSQDTSAFYLGNIYGVLADPNATHASIPSPVAKPPPFSAPRYAVWANSLWFLSLVMSVSCALWATSLHQWARRYIRHTQPARCSPEKRARMRAYFANGVDNMHISWAVEGLPILLHLSLFLFFCGLVIYLFKVDQEVFMCVVSWIGLFSMVYGFITVLPLFKHHSPYNTPLSRPHLFECILYLTMLIGSIAFYPITVLLFIVSCCLFLVFFCYVGMTSASSDERRTRIVAFISSYILLPIPSFLRRSRNSISSQLLINFITIKRGGGDSGDFWVLKGVGENAEETTEKQSSEIDGRILGWTISALGDDDSLEAFFEAMPGFFDSEKVKYQDLRKHLPYDLLRNALAGFLGRTLSSKSISNSVKFRRLDIFMRTINLIGEDSIRLSSILESFLFKHWDIAPQTIEVVHTLAPLCASDDQRTAQCALWTVIKILAKVQERDERWVELAACMSGLPEHELRDIAQTANGDNLLLAILIDICRQAIIHEDESTEWEDMRAFTQFDIRDTLPWLQHDFCTLWNELVDKARNLADLSADLYSIVCILYLIRPLYLALHEGTDAAPIEFSAVVADDDILGRPSSYPLCNISSHRPDSTAHVPAPNSPTVPLLTQPGDSPDALPRHSTSDGIAFSQLGQEGAAVLPLPSHPTTPSEIGDSSLATAIISPYLPDDTSPRPTYGSPPSVVAAASQDTTPTTTMSHSLEETTWQDIAASFLEPDINRTLPTASTPIPTPTHTHTPAPIPTVAPVPASTPPVLNKSSGSSDTAVASASNLSLSASSPIIGFSIPAFPPQSHIPPSRLPSSRVPLSRATPLPNAESLGPLTSATPSHLTDSPTLPCLHARGLVNTGNMCFVNVVLQLLVHSPLLWSLFRELGVLNGQRREGALETARSTTPLVDSTVIFFEEFVFKQDLPKEAAGGKPGEDEEVKNQHNAAFEPMYMYNAMKEKRRLKDLLDGQQQDAEENFRLYLDALDEELLTLASTISRQKSAITAPGSGVLEEGEVFHSDHTEVENRGFMAELVESPLLRIFGGKFRSTLRAPNQHDTVTIEDWRSLHLDIEHDSVYTIEDALARVSHVQPVQLGPTGSSEASQQVFIEGLPPVLVLHLKRFLYDVDAGGIVKIRRPVHFAPELEIPIEIMAPVSGCSAAAAEPVHYKLYGVIYHHGESAGSGHYTVDVLHPSGESGVREAWLHIDDETVSAVRHEDVFGGHDDGRVDDRCAYMLFYSRTAPA